MMLEESKYLWTVLFFRGQKDVTRKKFPESKQLCLAQRSLIEAALQNNVSWYMKSCKGNLSAKTVDMLTGKSGSVC